MRLKVSPLGTLCYKPIPINEAEAIFLPLFDSKMHDISCLTAKAPQGGYAAVQQSWDSCFVKGNAPVITVRWYGTVPLGHYSAIRLFLSFPPSSRLSAWATINERRVELFRDITGDIVPIEPASGCLRVGDEELTLTQLELEYTQESGGEFLGILNWAGLVNSEKEPVLAAPQSYPKAWEGLLVPKACAGIRNPWVGSIAEIESWKSRIASAEFASLRQRVEVIASEWDGYEPENDLREYVPVDAGAYRYVRLRDRGRPCWDEPLTFLALAGYLCERPDWTQKAARLLLCLAWTPNWFEGPQGNLVGSDWHHVCFQEAHAVVAMLFALQFVGDALTPEARAIVLNRIEAALPLINKCCEEPGYRWHMNQGVVFNAARVVGAAGLHANHRGPQYVTMLMESYRDYHTVSQNYYTEDGHCCEGPLYFRYSLISSVLAWMAMAEWQGVGVETILPDNVKALGAYAEATISTVYDDGRLIPLGPIGYAPLPCSLLVMLGQWCGWRRGADLIEAHRQRGFTGLKLLPIDLIALLGWYQHKPVQKKAQSWASQGCMPSGLGYFSWENPMPGKLLLTAERPSKGHYHQDRGGIVLEAGGRVCLPDPGMTNYANTRAQFMKEADWHNLAKPVGLAMICADTINPPGRRATIKQWKTCTDGVRFRVDLSAIYTDPVLHGSREGAVQLKGLMGKMTLRDIWSFSEPRAVELCYQSYYRWQIDVARGLAEDGQGLTIKIKNPGQLRWQILDDRYDWEYRKVYTLKLTTEPSNQIELTSRIDFSLDGAKSVPVATSRMTQPVGRGLIGASLR